MLLALSSKEQDYFKSRINLFVALGPASKISNINSPILSPLISKKSYNVIDFWNKLPFVHWYRLFDLDYQKYQEWIFKFTPLLSLAYDRGFLNSKIEYDDPLKIWDLCGHIPGGVSLKNLFHYAQTAITDEFRDWDYSLEFKPKKTNMEVYGTEKPPLIDLRRIRQTGIPIAMFVGYYDELASFKDSLWLLNEL